MPQTGKTPKKQPSIEQKRYKLENSANRYAVLRDAYREGGMLDRGITGDLGWFEQGQLKNRRRADQRRKQTEGRMTFEKKHVPYSQNDLPFPSELSQSERYLRRKPSPMGQSNVIDNARLSRGQYLQAPDSRRIPETRNRPRGKTIPGMMGAAGFGLGQMLREKMMKEQPSKKR